ncbi:hypothetical protein [Natrinema salaciae]|uniref:Uncharacterized protein n=1 Tax=Natrinema salaciae TaxID=1186196 RepID=A0A1H9KBI5_9EURY|nr:hypothetical protein [Natrinema salaciae]SEQ96452.1 hypothetical protein SAMN04489841_2868 [Natrinema salaciae]
MRRRGLLERLGAGTGATTVGAVAGCLGTEGGEPEPGSESGSGPKSETGDPGTVVSSRISSEGVCAEGTDAGREAIVTITAAGVELTGSIEAPTPCSDASLSAIEFVTPAELAVTVGLEEQDGVCGDCLGRIDYAATIEIDGTLPETVTVTHDAVAGETTIENTTVESD